MADVTTEAGRALLEHLVIDHEHVCLDADDILAIEREATEDADAVIAVLRAEIVRLGEAAEAARTEVADPRLDLGPRCRGESPDGACDDETCEAHGAATAGREPLRVRSLVARLTNALGRYADFRDHGALATAAMEWDEIEVLAERVLRAALDTPDPAETNRG